MMNFTKTRNYAYIGAFIVLMSVSLSADALGAPSSLPPGDRQQLDSSIRESGDRVTDIPSRNETMNEIRATPTTPPPSYSSGPSAPPSGASTPPLPPLSGGKP